MVRSTRRKWSGVCAMLQSEAAMATWAAITRSATRCAAKRAVTRNIARRGFAPAGAGADGARAADARAHRGPASWAWAAAASIAAVTVVGWTAYSMIDAAPAGFAKARRSRHDARRAGATGHGAGRLPARAPGIRAGERAAGRRAVPARRCRQRRRCVPPSRNDRARIPSDARMRCNSVSQSRSSRPVSSRPYLCWPSSRRPLAPTTRCNGYARRAGGAQARLRRHDRLPDRPARRIVADHALTTAAGNSRSSSISTGRRAKWCAARARCAATTPMRS